MSFLHYPLFYESLNEFDVITLAAYHFGEQVVPGSDKTFLEIWQENGGVRHDLKQMVGEQVEWLIHRPALALVEDNLLAHADACFYTDYGGSIDEVNWSFVTLLDHRDRSAWGQLINDFKEHQTFSSQKNGLDQLQSFLDRFGGRRFIHGHTPIFKFTGQAPETVRDPLIYARGLCINLDGGVYLGGPGFFFRLNSNNEGDKGETS